MSTKESTIGEDVSPVLGSSTGHTTIITLPFNSRIFVVLWAGADVFYYLERNLCNPDPDRCVVRPAPPVGPSVCASAPLHIF